jgi:hypothetical protein
MEVGDSHQQQQHEQQQQEQQQEQQQWEMVQVSCGHLQPAVCTPVLDCMVLVV